MERTKTVGEISVGQIWRRRSDGRRFELVDVDDAHISHRRATIKSNRRSRLLVSALVRQYELVDVVSVISAPAPAEPPTVQSADPGPRPTNGLW